MFRSTSCCRSRPSARWPIFEWYLPEKEHSSPAAKASVEFSDQIQVEDVAICERVQKNLRLTQLLARPLQREAGKGRARFSSDVCGMDEKGLTAENAEGAENNLRILAPRFLGDLCALGGE